MAEPFKEFLNAERVHDLARHLQRANAHFPAQSFLARVLPQLAALELKARAMVIADALEFALPTDFGAAAQLIEQALAPVGVRDDAPMMAPHAEGLSGWMLWPVGEYVARRGLDAPERALRTLHALTQRFTAEWALRPFVLAHSALVFRTLARWVSDPSEHVRRLVSEGTRPRLPWGLQLKPLIADPSPTWPLLERLLDDPSEYVRRSVANHLNDVAKDHPALVTQWVKRHLRGASAPRRALLKHASRTLIKQGNRPMLEVWGMASRFAGKATLTVSPTRIALGGAVQLTLTLRSTARTAQPLTIDYRLHHVKANGSANPKVFKGWTVIVPPRGTITLSKRHAVRPITTRRYHAGRHLVDVQVNGSVLASAAFALRIPDGDGEAE
jgi:3-methyladenine DNA glycosylase AlkC